MQNNLSKVHKVRLFQIADICALDFLLALLHFQNLSNCCRHKYNPVNFTNFMNLIFGGFFAIWPKHQATLPRPRSTPCRRGGLSWCACASFSPTKSPSVPTCFCPSPLPTLGAPTRHRSNTVHRKQCSLHIYFSIWMIGNQNLKKKILLNLHTIWL